MNTAFRAVRVLLRVVGALAALPAALLAVGVLLLYIPTNHSDVIVRTVFRVDRYISGAFGHLFALKSARASVGLDWVVAALAWLAVAAVLRAVASRLPARIGTGAVTAGDRAG